MEVILPFYSSRIRLHVDHCVQVWAPQYIKGKEVPKRVQWRAIKRRRLEHFSHEIRLNEQGLLSLEKRGTRGIL